MTPFTLFAILLAPLTAMQPAVAKSKVPLTFELAESFHTGQDWKKVEARLGAPDLKSDVDPYHIVKGQKLGGTMVYMDGDPLKARLRFDIKNGLVTQVYWFVSPGEPGSTLDSAMALFPGARFHKKGFNANTHHDLYYTSPSGILLIITHDKEVDVRAIIFGDSWKGKPLQAAK